MLLFKELCRLWRNVMFCNGKEWGSGAGYYFLKSGVMGWGTTF